MDAGKCTECQHSSLSHYSYFNKKVVIPIQAFGYIAEGKLALIRLQNDILHHVRVLRILQPLLTNCDSIDSPPKDQSEPCR